MATEKVISTAQPMSGPSVQELERLVNSGLNGRVKYFRLTVEGQGLVLRGKARSYYAKQMAQHLVMDATTMPILANNIEVVDRQQT